MFFYGFVLALVLYGLVFAVCVCVLWRGLGISFLMFLCGSYCVSLLFCHSCGCVLAVVLYGVVLAWIFLSYCIALSLTLSCWMRFLLAESSCCCVSYHLGFSIMLSLPVVFCGAVLAILRFFHVLWYGFV